MRARERLCRFTLAVAAAALVAGCGGHHRAPAPAPRAAPERSAQLLYVWRNFELTGIPEEMTVYADGRVRYRNLLHTQSTLRVLTARLAPTQLARLRRLLGAVDLSRADASGVKPRRDGYRYVIRSRGRVGTAADGHLHGAMRPLVSVLRAEMDRLQARSL
jgi:hypothetical protein